MLTFSQQENNTLYRFLPAILKSVIFLWNSRLKNNWDLTRIWLENLGKYETFAKYEIMPNFLVFLFYFSSSFEIELECVCNKLDVFRKKTITTYFVRFLSDFLMFWLCHFFLSFLPFYYSKLWNRHSSKRVINKLRWQARTKGLSKC